MTEPTDAEIRGLAATGNGVYQDDETSIWEITDPSLLKFARAVLTEWGTPSAVAEPSEAEIVFAAISSGEWTVSRNLPSSYMTDEGNARNAWSVQRAVAPYCADLGPRKGWGNRMWNGPTALAALEAASKEMGIPLPVAQKGRR